jgi:hypothetical protein
MAWTFPARGEVQNESARNKRAAGSGYSHLRLFPPGSRVSVDPCRHTHHCTGKNVAAARVTVPVRPGIGRAIHDVAGRWLAMRIMVTTIGGLVPAISSAQIGLRFFAYGLEIAVFAPGGFYLAKAPTVLETLERSCQLRIEAVDFTLILGHSYHENRAHPRRSFHSFAFRRWASPTRWLTSKRILPVFLSASTIR